MADPTSPIPADAGNPNLFSLREVEAILADAKARGPEAYARAVRAAADDGYALPEEHKAALTAAPQPRPAKQGITSLFAPPTPGQGTDQRSADERDIVNSSLAPAHDPADYKINWNGLTDRLDPTQVRQLDNNMRGFLSDLGMSGHVGGSVAELGMRDAARFQHFSEAEREAWRAQQRAELGRLYPNPAAVAARVDKLIADFDPEFMRLLASNGFFSARVVAQLYLQSQRLEARSVLQKRRAG